MADTQPGLVSQAMKLVSDVANRHHVLSKLVPPALFLLDGILCALIIWKVPYTEIDWKAYMEQVSQYVSGERDYTLIKGGTGPLVYPAAHVYTYTGLYHLTDQGKDIFMAQQLFAVLYMVTLAVVMACYWKAKVPPYVFPLLIASKRLHSIFVLRCFNDCFAVFFLWLAIYCFQYRAWTLGSIAYIWGLGIKMSLLLVLPAVGVILLQGRGFSGSLKLAAIMVQIQVAIANPFLRGNASGYLSRAFELSRQFLFKWTVNWRFVGEEVFLSRPFALGLLGLHAAVLAGFLAQKWLKPARKPLFAIISPILRFQSPFSPQEEPMVASQITPQFVTTTMLSANVIGLLFARSLHYQFYSYLAWSTPYLLWRSGAHPVVQYVLWAAQEWAWNIFPSTPASSGVVVGVLAITVVLSWGGATNDLEAVSAKQVSPADKAA
ncbi:Dolichyl-P-Man:Man(5)GlcNAc(2)-PP-dolichyl mannosyltransferase [Pseudomassariella vexata]|uniref:Dol-P-Man:Man(5)GlcNAc(2)-PP-Dol alpha-1,3-mannosyltransferase n=1 Tax=Pseudomassariella vexata TaxID=1141098 RepID=A0A1Y2DW94_9PEZI|nr:Dolichyl-P-Man:Man(5)GlcNAc(2)-PP-dolichyl mannosyltransferase [Pseudomassariella vexata]ORY62895.1 Dolichyl-P-Man:Man(5)GlcNAc(2)-PP-dolichyl mannosyltransferase [Pseudomassariella vexata]